MPKKRLLLSIFILLASLAAALGLVVAARAGLTAQEITLNQNGEVYELNLDPQGILWVSDFGAGEIRRVDPVDGSYIVYRVDGGPSDARSDGAGSLWWVDALFNQVGRMPSAGGSASLWEVPGSIGLYGSGLGDNNDIWVTDFYEPYLYHLTPGASEICTVTLPLDGTSDYMLVDEDYIWLGDNKNAQIDRYDVISDTFTTWSLPMGSRLTGLALDVHRNLWWADTDRGLIGNLITGTNQVITYDPSLALTPKMLVVSDDLVWFSAQDKIGVLDPTLVQGVSSTVEDEEQAAVSKCGPLAVPVSFPITTSPGSASWSEVTYESATSPSGWHLFQLPQASISWGIAAVGENIWLLDQGRQVLAKLPKQIESYVYLPIVKR